MRRAVRVLRALRDAAAGAWIGVGVGVGVGVGIGAGIGLGTIVMLSEARSAWRAQPSVAQAVGSNEGHAAKSVQVTLESRRCSFVVSEAA